MKKSGAVIHTPEGDRIVSSRVPVSKVFRKHWLLLLMLLPVVIYVLLFAGNS